MLFRPQQHTAYSAYLKKSIKITEYFLTNVPIINTSRTPGNRRNPTHIKKKPPTGPASYKPISLTSAISVVFEAVINRTLKFYTNKAKIIPDNQFGFKHRHSTVHAIHKIFNDINAHLYTRRAVVISLPTT